MRMSLICKQKGQSRGKKRSLTAISRGLPVNPKLQQPKNLKQWGREPHPTPRNGVQTQSSKEDPRRHDQNRICNDVMITPNLTCRKHPSRWPNRVPARRNKKREHQLRSHEAKREKAKSSSDDERKEVQTKAR
ncbi:hypothetical protein NC651_028547 [Populus alba x Populus x berolinensis]|nr:hypothetical protein NC651_028547 [Populus alba x Populus x berolinensis]